MSEKRGWDSEVDRSNPNPVRTIVVSQPARKDRNSLSNDEPLTDEYLDSILPSVGYKIVPPPPGYVPMHREPRRMVPEAKDHNLPRVPEEFATLFTDLRPDEELSPEEKQERHVMKLLMQVKEGTPYQRKIAMRILTTHANDFGAELIFSKLLPLLSSGLLNEQERHSLMKAVDRLMNRLAASMQPYVPHLLAFAGRMLIESDTVVRNEAREVVGNLAKISGLPAVLNAVKASLGSDDKTTREVVARTMATSACAVGIAKIIPFLNAIIRTDKGWEFKHTGIRTIDSIAFECGSGVLPFLRELVPIVTLALKSEEPRVSTTAVKCITTMAHATAPFGGDAFNELVPIIWSGIDSPMHKHCLRAITALVMTMEKSVAMRDLRRLVHRILRDNYAAMTANDRLLRIEIFQNALERGAYDIETIDRFGAVLFSSLWSTQSITEQKVARRVVTLTVEFAKRSSVSMVLDCLFGDFRVAPIYFKELAVECLGKIVQECGTFAIPDEQLALLNDHLIFAIDEIDSEKEGFDERKTKFYMKILGGFVESMGERAAMLLDDMGGQIMDRLQKPSHKLRQHAVCMLKIYAEAFASARREILVHFYGIIQEFLGEDYPDVLAAVLDAIKAVVDLLETEELNPPPDDVAGRLVPILKNRNTRVSYSCVSLITSLSEKSPEIIHNKEWMRICFELLELLKNDTRKVRVAAINAFACIARAIGPFDVLLALLNNLQVQDRQIRLCTTSAIAVLAQKCGPHLILPALMNEYRTPDANVQNGTLKAMQFLFQEIGSQCADYAYAVTPLITHALIERDSIHRQIACSVVKNFALGCFAAGKEDALIHLLNHVMPNIFEPTLHFIDAVMEAIDSLRVSLGPGIVLQYVIAGLFHPARKVRSQYWRVFNNLIIYSADALVPYYPQMENTETNNYHRDEFDVFV